MTEKDRFIWLHVAQEIVIILVLLMVAFLMAKCFCMRDVSGATYPLIVDHSCLDYHSIPQEYIALAKQNIRFHYCHTSHGCQVDECGLTRLMQTDPFYRVSIGAGFLPADTAALCIMEGQTGLRYITPGQYWQGAGLEMTRATLRANPSINVSGFMWCGELKSYNRTAMQTYLDSMAVLEREFPNVTFVYMTGNSQADGLDGAWNYFNNELIRVWCRAGNRVLYDFGDIDCWHDGEQNIYHYSGSDWWDGWKEHIEVDVPRQHPEYAAEQCGHTTFENCENKAKAAWWMFASLAGWDEDRKAPSPPTNVGIEVNGTDNDLR